jgi:hypothetical protein
LLQGGKVVGGELRWVVLADVNGVVMVGGSFCLDDRGGVVAAWAWAAGWPAELTGHAGEGRYASLERLCLLDNVCAPCSLRALRRRGGRARPCTCARGVLRRVATIEMRRIEDTQWQPD